VVRDGIPGEGPMLGLGAVVRQVVAAMEADGVPPPAQANLAAAGSFALCRNVAAEVSQVAAGRGSGRWRIGVLLAVLVMFAAVVVFVASARDGSSGGSAAPPSSSAGRRPAEPRVAVLVKPPPLPPSARPPVDTGKPDARYLPRSACVASQSDGDVPASWGQKRFDLPRLHALATGRGQTVAVIDTGVNPHPLLGQRLRPGHDYVVEAGGSVDCDGHGTEVAGLIAAGPASPAGGAFQGVAPDATVLAVRQSSGSYARDNPETKLPEPAGNLDTLAQAIVGAADAGAGVIAVTVSGCRPATGPSTPAEQAVQAAIRYAVDVRNSVVVTTAGNLSGACPGPYANDPNRSASIPVPAWFFDDVLAVTALASDGQGTDFSLHGPWVGVAAPGTDITTLDPGSTGLTRHSVTPDGELNSIQGTSFAAAYVAGLAALVREYRPALTARQVVNRIKLTSANAGHRDDDVGYGPVQPLQALTARVPGE
jgi:membrane-anchored mycosin MYCP